jgi:hypothetical protein
VLFPAEQRSKQFAATKAKAKGNKMAQVRVWNDNKYEFKQRFMEENIVIPPKGFILMDESKAIRFRGHYSPIEVDGNGVPLETSYKMIRLEEIVKDAKPIEKIMCMACAKDDFQSQKDLDAHIDESHAHIQADQDYKEKKAKNKNG